MSPSLHTAAMIAHPASAPCNDASPLSGRNIICLSHDWGGDPLSRDHLMRLLARDNRILWVNSIGYRAPGLSRRDLARAWRKLWSSGSAPREVERNIFVMNPLALPVYGNGVARRINRRWLASQIGRVARSLGMTRPISWIGNPAAAVVAGHLGETSVIYHCVDEFSQFRGVSRTAIADLERQLLSRADLVIATSEALFHSKRLWNPRTILVPHGVDHLHFQSALSAELPLPADVRGLPSPRIGFFGLLGEWIDVELLAAVARRFPHGSLVLIGQANVDLSPLAAMANVHLLGRRPYSHLPGYCKAFDVAIVPFCVNELTRHANPLKVREYLSAGLPVVSTALPEVARLGLCQVAQSHEQFLAMIKGALGRGGPRRERSEAVRGESWEARLETIRLQAARLLGCHGEPSSDRAPGDS